MKPAFGQNISLMCFFGGSKQAYANRLVIYFYFGQPFTVFFSHTKKTALTAPATSVLRVFHIRNLAQICELVVGAVSVNMVDLIYRPLTPNVKPGQVVRQIQYVVQSDAYVPMFHFAPRHITQSATTPNFSPRKQSCIGAIVKKFVQSIWRHAININPVLCEGQA